VANGAAPTANPILVAGSDGTLTRTLKTSETGEVVVDSLPAGDNNIGKVGIDQTTPGTTNKVVAELTGSILAEANVTNVASAGTREQLPNIPCREVTIIAKRTNTGYIYAGKNTVSSTVYGVELAAKDSFTFVVKNANEIYIDASVNGEGISYVAI